MKITDLHVSAFGVCRDLDLAKLADNLTVIYGPNEAGKTTLMQFVRGVLYGYQTDRLRYLGIHQAAEHGGWLDVTVSDGQSGKIRRLAEVSRGGQWNEEIRVEGSQGDGSEAAWLERILVGVDEEIFNNVFTVGLHELQQLGALDDTAAAEHLYELTTGLDRVSLAEVMQFLSRSQAELLSSESGPGQIPFLCQRQRQLSGELKGLARSSRNWGRLIGRQQAVESDIANLQDELTDLREGQRLHEIALQIFSQWDERRDLQQQLERLGPLVSTAAGRLPHNARQQLDELNLSIENYRGSIEKIREQRRELGDAIASNAGSRRVLLQAARIEAVREHGQWIASIATQRESLQGEVSRLEQEVERQCPGVGLSQESQEASLPELTPRLLSVVRRPARALKEERLRLEQAESELRDDRRQFAEAEGTLETTLAGKGVSDLTEALTEAGQLVNQLRRRVGVEEQLDRLARNRLELDNQSQDLLKRELLPIWLVASLGGVFVGGFVFMFTGLLLGSFFALSGSVGALFCVFGLGGMLAALGVKQALEKSHRQRQETCRKQLEMITLQESQAFQERDTLDVALTGGYGAWDHRSQQAEAALAELEKLVPVDAERVACRRRVEAGERRIDQLQGGLRAATDRWEQALQGVGLPTGLTPKQVRRLAEDARYVSDTQVQLRQRRVDLQRCENEIGELTNRVNQLFFDIGVTPVSEDLTSKLRELYGVLQQERELSEQRRLGRRKDRQFKREGRRLVDQLNDQRRKKRNLLGQAGVIDEQEFCEIAEQRDVVLKLQGRLKQLNDEIDVQTKGRCEFHVLETAMNENDPETLNATWDEIQDRIDRRSKDLDRLHTKLGEVRTELKISGEDQRMVETRFELGCVEQELAVQVERWQVRAMTGHVLQAVRDIYERDRQPETLQDASAFLQRMTNGRYPRVWTPLDQNVLQVDDAAGNVLALEELSRGTREAVFICLRLALVRGYARRGMALPLILDDVLVNCDGQRAQQAVEVLCEFADLDQQILFFTCHQHIVAMFEEAGVEIRTLADSSVEAELIAGGAGSLAATGRDDLVASNAEGPGDDKQIADAEPEDDDEEEYEEEDAEADDEEEYEEEEAEADDDEEEYEEEDAEAEDDEEEHEEEEAEDGEEYEEESEDLAA